MAKHPWRVGKQMVPSRGEFGSLLRARRVELRLTLQDVADRMGVCRELVSQIEIGKLSLVQSPHQVKKLASILDIELPELTKLVPAIKPYRVKRNPDSLGKFLTTRRQELRLTQQVVGARLQRTGSCVSMVERGDFRPSQKLLKRWVTILGCQIPVEFL